MAKRLELCGQSYELATAVQSPNVDQHLILKPGVVQNVTSGSHVTYPRRWPRITIETKN